MTLLNGFRLQCRGQNVQIPANTQRVLAFLALGDGDLLRTHVAHVLWPDTSEERAAANLRTALWRLQSHRVEVIQSNGRMLSLAASVVVDVREMEWLARRVLDSRLDQAPEADLLTRAGELLPGFDEEWLLVERERLRQLRLHALEALCQRLVVARSYDKAVAAGLAAVAGEPLRESAQRALINAYMAEGNRVEAMRQFERYRHMLHNELGLEPPPELALEVAIPNGKTPHQLKRWKGNAAFTLLAGGFSGIVYGQFAENIAAMCSL